MPYALKLFRGTKLFNRVLNLNARGNASVHVPVLDTHLSDAQVAHMGHQGDQSDPHCSEMRGRKRHRSGSRSRSRSRSHSRSSQARNSDKPQSWSEYNALRGKGSLANDLTHRTDLHGPAGQMMMQPQNFNVPPNFEALLQMGQQMLIPGAIPGIAFFNQMSVMGAAVPMMPNMYPSSSMYEPERRGVPEHRGVPEYRGASERRGEPERSGWGRGGAEFKDVDTSRYGGYNRDEVGRSDSSDRRETRRGEDYDRNEARRGYEGREGRRDENYDRRDVRRDSGIDRYDRRRDNGDSRESRSYQPYDRRQSHSYNQSSHGRESRDRRRN